MKNDCLFYGVLVLIVVALILFFAIAGAVLTEREAKNPEPVASTVSGKPEAGDYIAWFVVLAVTVCFIGFGIAPKFMQGDNRPRGFVPQEPRERYEAQCIEAYASYMDNHPDLNID